MSPCISAAARINSDRKLVTNSSPKLVKKGRFGDDFKAEKQGK
jgi:hypothetical protein